MRLITVFTAFGLFAAFHASSVIAQDSKDPVLIYTDWSKSCPMTENARHICITGKHAHHPDGTRAASAQLMESENEPKAVFRVILPLGMQLIPGTRLIIDQHPPANAPYMSCDAKGCVADYDVNADMIGKLKGGRQLAVQGIVADGSPVSLVFALKDLGRIHDGPSNDVRLFAEPLKRQPGSWNDDRLQPHLRPVR